MKSKTARRPLRTVLIAAVMATGIAGATAFAFGPEAAGFIGGEPFYAGYDYSYDEPRFACGKNFVKFTESENGEKVWIWFPRGVSELRIYEVKYVPAGENGVYGKLKLGRELHRTGLGASDVLELTTIAEAAPPRAAIWFEDPEGVVRAYCVGWSGLTGAVRLVPMDTVENE
jgi:hypothetical protein